VLVDLISSITYELRIGGRPFHYVFSIDVCKSVFTRPAGGGSEEVRTYRALAFANERLKRLLGEKELKIAVLKDLVRNDLQIGGRFAVAESCIKQGYKARIVLRAVGLSRSTYYYGRSHKDRPEGKHSGGRPIPGYSKTRTGRIVSDNEVSEWICELIEGEGYAYGYPKLTVCLRKRYSLVINKKKVYRLCKELGVLRPHRMVKPKRRGGLRGTEWSRGRTSLGRWA